MISRILLTFLIVSALSVVYQPLAVDTQYVPVSKRYPGLYFPGDNAVVDLELIYDPVCTHLLMKVERVLKWTKGSGR